MYPEITKFLPFVLDDKGFLTNQKCFIMTGDCIEYLVAFFNSSLFKFCFLNNFSMLGDEGRELRKIFFDKIPVLKINAKTNTRFKEKILEIQQLKIQNINTKDKEIEIDNIIFDLYELATEERNAIGFIEIQ